MGFLLFPVWTWIFSFAQTGCALTHSRSRAPEGFSFRPEASFQEGHRASGRCVRVRVVFDGSLFRLVSRETSGQPPLFVRCLFLRGEGRVSLPATCFCFGC